MSKKDIEKELWEQIGSIIDTGSYDFVTIMSMFDKDMLEKIEHDEFILGLSGVDPGAINRIQKRREYIDVIKQTTDKIKQDQNNALNRWKERQEILKEKK